MRTGYERRPNPTAIDRDDANHSIVLSPKGLHSSHLIYPKNRVLLRTPFLPSYPFVLIVLLSHRIDVRLYVRCRCIFIVRRGETTHGHTSYSPIRNRGVRARVRWLVSVSATRPARGRTAEANFPPILAFVFDESCLLSVDKHKISKNKKRIMKKNGSKQINLK